MCENSPRSVEGEAVDNLPHVRPDGADDFEPGRELAVMFGQEGGESLPVVWPVLLRLAEPVYEEDGELGVDLPLLVEVPQWLQHPGQQGLAGVALTVGETELGEDVRLGLEEVVVAPQLGSLAQLAGQRLEELRHQAGGGVVRPAEMSGNSAGGQQGAALATGRHQEAAQAGQAGRC